MSSADDQYEQQNDVTSGDVPSGDAIDNDYKSRTGQSHIPVLSDDAPVSDPIDPATADSDETLGMPSLSLALLVLQSWSLLERALLTFPQPRMMSMQSIRATSSVGVPEVLGLREDIQSLAMRKGCRDLRMGLRQLARRL